jgi:hypothetical protein
MNQSPTQGAPPPPPLLRHILPVIAGGFLCFVLTLVTDNTLAAHGALSATGGAADTGHLLLIGGYRGLFAVLGCHLAARLAPEGNPRIRYALALGFLLMAVSIAAAISSWGQVPAWYSLGAVAITIPCAIIGGATAVRVLEKARQGLETPEGRVPGQ